MRTLVIGDIHGSLESLKGVLDLAQYDPKKDRLICLGDYVDGWEESYEVVQLLIDYQDQSPHDNIYLLGNHDAYFKDVLSDGIEHFRDIDYTSRVNASWWEQDGASTYRSYSKQSDEDILKHHDQFFNHLKYYHIENNMLFVHAGFTPRLGFEKTYMISKDEVIWTRTLYRKSVMMNKDDHRFDGYEKIFIGHTPTTLTTGIHPKQYCNVINLDQSCKLTKRLTAWELQSDSYFQYSVPD